MQSSVEQHHLPPSHPAPPMPPSPQAFVLLNPRLRPPLTYFISVSVLAVPALSTVLLLNNGLEEGTRLLGEST